MKLTNRLMGVLEGVPPGSWSSGAESVTALDLESRESDGVSFSERKHEDRELNAVVLRSRLRKGVNILITAASRRVALIQSFQNALDRLGLKGRVITVDNNPLSPGLYVSGDHFLVPLATDPDYIPRIKALCVRENIALIVPTIDDELPLFGRCVGEFARLGVQVLVSGERTGEICNDKYLTYQFLRESGIPTAETLLPEEIRFDQLRYPLFIKPRRGRGSVGAHSVRNEKELRFFLDYVPDPIVQRFLHGREFTIDLLADFQGRVLSIVPRERLWVRAGVVDRGRTLHHHGLMLTARRVAEALGIRGAANIQCMLDHEFIDVIEINPRFSGGIPLTIAAGADFSQWVIQMLLGVQLQPRIGDFLDRLTMVCYESSIFLDPELQVLRPAPEFNGGLVAPETIPATRRALARQKMRSPQPCLDLNPS